jgi:predicted transcriptional regulator
MKRSRDKIISEILEACINGANKTRIVYQANLNFRTINPYLELLTRNGLINVEKDQTVVYTTTLKGLNLLDDFKRIQEELSIPADDTQNSVRRGS